MKPIKVKNLLLGQGNSKIAVSLTGSNLDQIKQQLTYIKTAQPDLIEWRMDCFDTIPEDNIVKTVNQLIRHDVPAMPIIATFRTNNEGGNQPITNTKYQQLLTTVSKADFDLIDLEINRDPQIVKTIINVVHQNQKLLLASFHNFKKTPPVSEINATLQKMQAAGADLAKVAVMPNDQADVLRLITASYQNSQRLNIPVISMAMGSLGTITRVSGSLSNSAITFGSLNTSVNSAPGQIPVAELRRIINII